MSFVSAISIPLACLSGIWIPATLLCCLPWVQKQMLYLHKVTFWPGRRLEEPERIGFLKNQVAPFRIHAKGGESLFTWLVAPLGAYARNADRFIAEKSDMNTPIEDRAAFQLLREDPEARLLIYFHGNTGTVAQGRRTEEYRSYSSGASDKIFVLAFDYRGYGKSTGTPSEEGIVKDAISVVEWAQHVAGIPPERIVLLGHSLGTAIATAVAHYYIATADKKTEFGGLILCAAFTNAGRAFSSYSIAGIFPVLAPIRLVPTLQTWFSRRMRDTWFTDRRLMSLVRESSKFRVVLVHAEDDATMPWDQTEELFKAALRAADEGSGEGRAGQEVTPPPTEPTTHYAAKKGSKNINLGEAGRQEIWRSDNLSISKLIAKHGSHDTMMNWSPIALAVLECFDLSTVESRPAN